MYVCVCTSVVHIVLVHITCVCLCFVLYPVSIIHVQHETNMRTIVCFLVTSLIFSVLWLNFVFYSDGLIRWNHLRNNWKVRFHTSSCRKWSNITTCVSYIITSHLQYKLHSYWFFSAVYYHFLLFSSELWDHCHAGASKGILYTATDDDSCVCMLMCAKILYENFANLELR